MDRAARHWRNGLPKVDADRLLGCLAELPLPEKRQRVRAAQVQKWVSDTRFSILEEASMAIIAPLSPQVLIWGAPFLLGVGAVSFAVLGARACWRRNWIEALGHLGQCCLFLPVAGFMTLQGWALAPSAAFCSTAMLVTVTPLQGARAARNLAELAPHLRGCATGLGLDFVTLTRAGLTPKILR